MVAQVKTYTVEASRDGKWWLLRTLEAPGAVSQVRSLSQADEYIREAIAYVVGVPPDSFDVEVRPVVPERVGKEIAGARAALADLDARQRAAAVLSRVAVKDLLALGVTGADAAVLLAVSPQRVSQLREGAKDVREEEVDELIKQYG